MVRVPDLATDGQEPEMMDPVKGNPVTDSIQVDFPPEDGYLTTSQQIQRLLNAGFPKFAKLVEASLRRRDAQSENLFQSY